MCFLFIAENFFYYNGLFAESIFSLPVVIPLRRLYVILKSGQNGIEPTEAHAFLQLQYFLYGGVVFPFVSAEVFPV